MAQVFDRWDPEGTGGFLGMGHQTWNLHDNNGSISFTPGEGSFVKYNNVTGASKQYVDHVFWNKNTGEVYYKDPDTGKYTKMYDSEVDTSGGLFKYASDNQLDKVAQNIENTIITNRNNKYLQEQNQQYQTAGPIQQIPIPTPETPDSLQQQEYVKRKQEADAYLQQLLVPDAEDPTPEEDSTVYYKYGPDEIDLKYYIHNLGTNLQKYLESKDWSKAQKQAFLTAYDAYKNGLNEQLETNSERFTTNDAGIIQDSQNILSGDLGKVLVDEQGNVYTSPDEIKNKQLRRSAVEFSPNEEVENYINTIGRAVVDAGKTKTSKSQFKGDFDLTKNGFVNYWVSKINPSGGQPDIDPYLALDPVSPQGKRERTNRTKYLVHELNKYKDKINNSELNFEGTPFKTKDAYILKIQQAIDNLQNGWDTTDPASLQAIGINSDFYSALMSEEANPLLSEAQIQEELAKNKTKAESDYIEKVKGVYDNYARASHTYTENNAVSYIKDSRYDPATPGAAQNIGTALRNLGYPISETPDTAGVATIINSLWEAIKASLRSGSQTVQTPSGAKSLSEILAILMPSYEVKFTESTKSPGIKFMNDPQFDSQYGAILCIKNGRLYYDFIGNVKDCQAWQQLASDFNKTYRASSDTPKYTFAKLGGVLKKLQVGGTIDAETLAALQQLAQMSDAEIDAVSSGQQTPAESVGTIAMDSSADPAMSIAQAMYSPRMAAAQQKGMSYEQYNKKQRSPNGTPDFYNQNNGAWKTEDYVRLGAIAADIASIPLPTVAGAAAGLGGTVMNLWADWADDSVTTTELFKNLGMNLGMDLLSIIPVFGDAADAGRLTKNLAKMAPKIGYALSAYGLLATLKNSGNIMESLKKCGTDEKLTVGDYQNIAQAIAAIAGINGGVKAGVAKRLAKKRAFNDNAVGVGLKRVDAEGKPIGEAKDFIFQGEKAKELRQLIKEGDIDAVNKKLQEFDGFEDFVVNTNLSSKPIGFDSPVGRTVGEDGKKHWGVKNPFTVQRTIDSFDVYHTDQLRGGYASQNLLNTRRQQAVIDSGNMFDEHYLRTKAEAEAANKAELESRGAHALEVRDKRLADIERTTKELEGVKDADGNVVTKGTQQILEEARTKKDDAASKAKKYQDAYDAFDDAYKQNFVRYNGRDYYLDANKPAGGASLEGALSTAKAKKIKTERSLQDYNRLQELLTKQQQHQQAKKKKKKQYALSRAEQQELTDLQTKLQNFDKDKSEKSLQRLTKKIDTFSDWITKHETALGIADRVDYFKYREKQLDAAINDTLDPKFEELRERLLMLQGKAPDEQLKMTTSRAKKNFLDFVDANSVDGVYKYIDQYGIERSVKNVGDLIKEMGLLKKGGRLQFLQYGGKKSNVTYQDPSKMTWNNGYAMKDGQFTENAKIAYSQITPDIIDEYNALQDSYRTVFAPGSTSPASGTSAKLPYSKTTELHQGKFDNLADPLNAQFEVMNPKFGSLANPNAKVSAGTRDSRAGEWRDGAAGSMTYLRHLGDKEEYVSKINNANVLGEGVEAYWDANKQMVKFRTKSPQETSSPENPMPAVSPTTPTPIPLGTDPIRIGEKNTPKGPAVDPQKIVLQQEIDKQKLRRQGIGFKNNALGAMQNLGDALPGGFDLLRYKLLDRANKRNADKAMAAVRPYYQNPKTDYTIVHGDLQSKALANETYAKLTRPAEKALTSDGAQQMAFKAQAHANAANAMAQIAQKDNDMYRKTQAEDWAQRKENHANEHLTAAQNSLSGLQAEQNKEDIRYALATQRNNDRDLFLQSWEYDYKTKQADKKALQEAAIQSRLQAAVQNDPNKYGAGLSQQELNVYNKALGGISPSSMTADEQATLYQANKKVAMAQQSTYFDYKGVNPDRYTADAAKIPSARKNFEVKLTPLAKDGTKLKIAKLREKSKNADRFQKSVQKQIDSLDKKLDRIAKSMYGLPKLEVIKSK